MKQLFENCGILAWKDDDFHYIPNGYLGIENDTICYIGDARPADAYDALHDYAGRLLMPGLINSHCHAAMTLLRGIGSDLPLDRWLFEKIFPIEDRMSDADLKAGNELAMMEMIAGGTTSFTDMYMQPYTAIESNERIGMKMNVGRVIQSYDPDETADDTPRIPEAIALYEKFNGAQNGRIRIDFEVHAEYTTNDAVTAGFADRCRAYLDRGAQMQIHLSETEKEHNECIARHGMTPAAWCEKMGLFDIPTVAAHCVRCTDADLEILKRHGVSPVHNPSSNMKLGSGFAPIPQMLEMGLNVALGTDGTASNNNLNMFEEMHIASIIHNGYKKDPTIMRPDQILKMATVNGAKLQGRHDTGKLETGMKADIIAIDFRNKAHLFPAFDPMVMLCYAVQASDVSMTMVDGRMLYEDGKFLTLNPEEVLRNARAAVERLYGGNADAR